MKVCKNFVDFADVLVGKFLKLRTQIMLESIRKNMLASQSSLAYASLRISRQTYAIVEIRELCNGSTEDIQEDRASR